jgi:hypothetical protein
MLTQSISAKCFRILFRQIILPVSFVFIAENNISAQEMNLPGYDHTKIHFGFIIGMNSTDFVIEPIANLGGHFGGTLKTIYSQPQPGFDIGPVAELKISTYLKLRFVPAISFAERDLTYSIAGPDTFSVKKIVESTFLNFPLDIKLISKRLVNFQAYVLCGVKYAADLASQSNVNQQLAGANATVRIIRNDYEYEAGSGVQFFFPYFKFGIEMKLSQGIRNLLIRDDSMYTQSLESLKSKVWLFALTFEG